ncbi:nucleoside deaminase [Oenococcus sp. UCMA 16435]|nr:nucleoside deaminase [Oenococcus sp. UCMA 16435]MDI4584786.1 nucleoside deaminase [Oenococcus sp. UCMA 14587]MDN6967641.1 nucleoside deaminase [Oenococcus sp. UCMA 17063]
MKLAVEQADENIVLKEGGPFGAVIVRDQEIICAAHNRVLVDLDPTAHAEIIAIRKACKVLATRDLSNCTLYTSCYPCPMCLSAVIWSNIKEVRYGNSPKEADKIGFRDNFIYKFIQEGSKDQHVLKIKQIDHDQSIQTFKNYVEDSTHEIY